MVIVDTSVSVAVLAQLEHRLTAMAAVVRERNVSKDAMVIDEKRGKTRMVRCRPSANLSIR